MRKRNRVLTWFVGAGLVAGAVLALRVDGENGQPNPPDRAERERVQRFHSDSVVLPEPGPPPDPPRGVAATPGPGRVRLAWADGLPGGTAPRGAVGYEVVLGDRTRLVTAPVTEFDGLPDGVPLTPSVRSVDAFGQRSLPLGLPGVAAGAVHESWRDGLTGLRTDFADGTRDGWHLSGYPGCVDVGGRSGAEAGLAVDLGCGADEAVLRPRAPLTLEGGTGRFVVATDAAGPGGRLTIDLAPGRVDRLGSAVPPGVLRVVADDAGVRIGEAGPTRRAPRRGAGVPHRFEVRLSPEGVDVTQDGYLVASSPTPVPWAQAYPLVGMRGPEGRRSRVHVTTAGFTGPATEVPAVVEVPVNPATRRVLGPAEQAPGTGIARTPLTRATAARFVATLTADSGLDPGAVTIQLGQATLPAPPATPGPFAPGAVFTVVAEIPPDLLGPTGPPTLSPLVVRAPGAGKGTVVQEMYVEADQAPPQSIPPQRTDARRPTRDALPRPTLTFGDAAGRDLPDTVPRVPKGRLLVSARIDAAATQWDTGSTAGVDGLRLFLDGGQVAGIPTSTDGPGVGGTYAIPIALATLAPGRHSVELRLSGVDGTTTSTLREFDLLP